MNYNKWDVVLVPFPFTNLTTTKKRPALIISPDEYNKNLDVVIAFITSKLDLEYRIGDYKIQEWEKSNLPKPSMLRMKFATIDKSIIIKKLGRLSEKDVKELSKLLIDRFLYTIEL
ncbi:type II toxin-antitoxin system PemK/MazF family toxin [candidate division KSB1 bacterium]|nr:type II toxin-antitoxin system PemK/MazF family toxin [candidate division KSB1 bacterium]NIR72055.1 type II toxin-antitoxin system PemK/MazF family toxin [candidate division KSB1 bacterium]NIS26568.1 type II toxin-antitoxin system PemK/MazF family toxin [candidate division KSB1 bacterium]NIT73330.1 type II toxin-antitoxin system PemK/MazF family toxin [candidate division KSB1 bacterium]NIU27178.1 type II toxin-antitoxin system PemK/MazF family toxin [candidate division KSB1 bacterium]